MTRIMASGVFDILHPGHISYLRQAKALGDELVVVIACDETVRRKKHDPITPDYMRARIVQELKPVDRAIVGGNGDIFETVKEIEPDIIVLGFDQGFAEGQLEKDLEEHGIHGVKVVRATETADDLNATRRIIKKIRDMGASQ